MRRVLTLVLLVWIAYFIVIHPWFMNWGATALEQGMALPGDEFMPNGTPWFTRAITVNAPPEIVWRWIVQMGQDRAGFYSNTWLENLTGADIHNANTLHSEWQQRQVGDRVALARADLFDRLFAGGTRTPIVAIKHPRSIAFIPCRFVLEPITSTSTRILVREPLPASRMGRFVNALLWDPMHFVMEQRMLRGIKERVEGAPLVPSGLLLLARMGWLLATLALSTFFLSGEFPRTWISVPLVWALPVLLLTYDLDAAMTAFLSVGITVAGILAFGSRWWPSFTLIATSVALVLVLTPDPYTVMGLGLGAAALVTSSIVVWNR